MGDLVLLETEINPVMLKMIEGGLEITAVHNHLLRASPATFYMHVGGHGDPTKMALAIRDALEASKTPPSEGGGHADEVPDDPGESVRSAAGHGGSDASGTAR